jgi:hypothetical protein
VFDLDHLFSAYEIKIQKNLALNFSKKPLEYIKIIKIMKIRSLSAKNMQGMQRIVS